MELWREEQKNYGIMVLRYNSLSSSYCEMIKVTMLRLNANEKKILKRAWKISKVLECCGWEIQRRRHYDSGMDNASPTKYDFWKLAQDEVSSRPKRKENERVNHMRNHMDFSPAGGWIGAFMDVYVNTLSGWIHGVRGLTNLIHYSMPNL